MLLVSLRKTQKQFNYLFPYDILVCKNYDYLLLVLHRFTELYMDFSFCSMSVIAVEPHFKISAAILLQMHSPVLPLHSLWEPFSTES